MIYLTERKKYTAKDIYKVLYNITYKDKVKEFSPEKAWGASDADIHRLADEYAVKYNDTFTDEDLEECAKYINSLKFPLSVYRGLWIRSGNISDIRQDKVGIYWTVDPEFIKRRTLFKYNYVLIGDISESDVNWNQTIEKFMYYSGGHSKRHADYSVQKISEMEITLKNRRIPDNLQVLTFDEFCEKY